MLLFAPLAAVLWLRSAAKSALPQLDGDVHLAGLSAPVTIRRDAHGVPHIDAATEDDLFIAQGYITAQDRLWQMDASRRSSNGDLAEIMGPALIQHDKTQRVLQIRLTAQRFYGRISADDRRRFDDYARGVNLFIAQCEQSNSLPVEFRLLHYRPAPWTGVDSISVGLSMVQTLDTHIATKLSRGRIAAKLNNPALESDLYPVGSWRDHPPTGVKLDLTQPQGLPLPPGNDDDDEENTESRAVPLATTQPAIVSLLTRPSREPRVSSFPFSCGERKGWELHKAVPWGLCIRARVYSCRNSRRERRGISSLRTLPKQLGRGPNFNRAPQHPRSPRPTRSTQLRRLRVRLQQLGNRRLAHRQRQAAPRERYAPHPPRAGHLVHGRPICAW